MSLLFLLPDLQRFLKVLKVQNDGTHGWNLCQPDMGVAKPNINPTARGLRSLNRVYIHLVESLNIPPMFKNVNGALLEVGEGRDRSQNLRNIKDKIVLGARFHIISPKKNKSIKTYFFPCSTCFEGLLEGLPEGVGDSNWIQKFGAIHT